MPSKTVDQLIAAYRKKTRQPSERHRQKGIIEGLRLSGYYVEKIGNGAFKRKNKNGSESFVKLGGRKGFADLLVIVPPFGLVVFLELKTEDGTVSVAQKIWHAAVKRYGAQTFVVRTLAEARAAMNQAIETDKESRKPRLVRMPPPRPFQEEE